MRAIGVLSITILLSGGAMAQPMSPAQAYIDSLKRQGERDYVHRFDRYRPSDVADCRSRANSVFGPIDTKEVVLQDCLEARRLRRAGH
jgi:hypothetical protein